MLVIAAGGNLSSRTALEIFEFLKEGFSRYPSMLIVPTATSDPKNFEEIRKFWADIFKNVEILPLHKKVNVNLTEEELRNAVNKHDFVFFSGGDQKRIINLIRGHDFHRILLERSSKEDFAVGGTSAGAAALGDLCILSGSPSRFYSVKVTQGLGFLKGYVVDQHFKERKRFGRLIHVVNENKLKGVGVDEDTAAVFIPEGSLIKVLGSGYVWFFERVGENKIQLNFIKRQN
ncbi:MAG: cyanophycinase [Candidatus Hydrothermia bacterium]